MLICLHYSPLAPVYAIQHVPAAQAETTNSTTALTAPVEELYSLITLVPVTLELIILMEFARLVTAAVLHAHGPPLLVQHAMLTQL